ncbi:MAG TPA: energy transducer TonB, partial [Candidatus Acidoferrum sp.]|nr:energy transducer TonB [Candidatus Acidoferrum sp.]
LRFSSTGPGIVKGWFPMNGGGAPLKLKTTAGKIRLQFIDAETDLRESLIRQQRERLEKDYGPAPPDQDPYGPASASAPTPLDNYPLEASWVSKLELALLGGVREDSDAFQRRLTFSPRPAYPMTARKGGVEGRVRLQVRLKQDGRVQVEKVVEGSEPSLVDAAIASIKTWRGKSATMGGKGVDVISTVTVEFHLR